MRLAAGSSLVFAALALGACRANVPVGHFACTRDDECPPAQRCILDRCQPITTDASVDAGFAADAVPMDAGMPDAALPVDANARDGAELDVFRRPDATFDAGPLHRVRVLLAVEDDRGAPLPEVAVSIGDRTQTVSFGCAATFEDVLEGVVSIDVSVGGISATEVVPVRADTLVVLGRTPAGTIAPHVTTDDVPASPPPSTATRPHPNPVRRPAHTSPPVVTDISTALGAEVPFGEWSADAATTGDAAVGLTYTRPWVFGPRILSTFTFRTPRSALVVLTGDGERHPALRGAPRAIVIPDPADACATPVLPDPMITAVNVTQGRGFGAPPVYFCQLGLGVTTGAAVGPASVSVTTTTFLGHDDFGMAATAEEACTGAPPQARLFDGASFDPPLLPGHRYLTIVSGVIDGRPPRDWTISFVQDPAPADVTVPGDAHLVGVRYVHAAPALAPRLDVVDAMTGTVLVDALEPGESAATLVPATDVGAITFAIRSDATSMPIARYLAPAPAPMQGGAFVIFSDVDLFPTDEIRQDVVFTPYSEPWTFDSRRPL